MAVADVGPAEAGRADLAGLGERPGTRVGVAERLVRGGAEVGQHERVGALEGDGRVVRLHRALCLVQGGGRGLLKGTGVPFGQVDRGERGVRERLGHVAGVVGGAGEGVQGAEVLRDVQVLQGQRRGGLRVARLERGRLKMRRLLVVAVLEVGVALEVLDFRAVRLPVAGCGLVVLARDASRLSGGGLVAGLRLLALAGLHALGRGRCLLGVLLGLGTVRGLVLVLAERHGLLATEGLLLAGLALLPGLGHTVLPGLHGLVRRDLHVGHRVVAGVFLAAAGAVLLALVQVLAAAQAHEVVVLRDHRGHRGELLAAFGAVDVLLVLLRAAAGAQRPELALPLLRSGLGRLDLLPGHPLPGLAHGAGLAVHHAARAGALGDCGLRGLVRLGLLLQRVGDLQRLRAPGQQPGRGLPVAVLGADQDRGPPHRVRIWHRVGPVGERGLAARVAPAFLGAESPGALAEDCVLCGADGLEGVFLGVVDLVAGRLVLRQRVRGLRRGRCGALGDELLLECGQLGEVLGGHRDAQALGQRDGDALVPGDLGDHRVSGLGEDLLRRGQHAGELRVAVLRCLDQRQ